MAVDTLTVVWADGRETTLTNIAADQMITITAPPFIQVPMLHGYGLVVLVIMLFVAPLALGIPRARAQRASSPNRRD
jgi:hypothetical protein